MCSEPLAPGSVPAPDDAPVGDVGLLLTAGAWLVPVLDVLGDAELTTVVGGALVVTGAAEAVAGAKLGGFCAGVVPGAELGGLGAEVVGAAKLGGLGAVVVTGAGSVVEGAV